MVFSNELNDLEFVIGEVHRHFTAPHECQVDRNLGLKTDTRVKSNSEAFHDDLTKLRTFVNIRWCSLDI